MFNFQIIDYFLYKKTDKLDMESLQLISDLFSSFDVSCYSLTDFEKLLSIALLLKCHWLYIGLEFVTQYTDCKIFHPNLPKINDFIAEDVMFILDNIKHLLHFVKTKDVRDDLNLLETIVETVKIVITEGGTEPWHSYLEKLYKVIEKLSCLVTRLQKPTFINLAESLAEDNVSLNLSNNYRKLQVVLNNKASPAADVDWVCSLMKSSGIEELFNLRNYCKGADVTGVEVIKTGEIQESFCKCRKYSKLMKETKKILESILTLKINVMISGASGISNLSGDEQTSTSVNGSRLSEESPKCAQSPVKVLRGRVNGNSKRDESSNGPEGTATRYFKQFGRDDDTTSVVSSANKRRCVWKEEETYWLYKGVQQGLSWAEIRDAYFSSDNLGRRTNVQLKDRWRYVARRSALLKTLEARWACDKVSRR